MALGPAEIDFGLCIPRSVRLRVKSTYGASKTNRMASGRESSIVLIGRGTKRKSALAREYSKFARIAAESSGVHSWSSTPGRIWPVHSVRSGEAVQPVSNLGQTFV